MDLREANYMVSIYKHKNITKAAHELYISQPSLSRYLQNVEKRLGFPLFDRMGNEFVPTYNGKRYLDYASRILMLGNEWEDEYRQLKNERKGELTIAIPLMRSSCMIPAVYPRFHHRYPEVSLNLVEETHTISEDLLLHDQIDFAVFNPMRISPSLEYIPLRLEPFVLVCKKGHPLASLAVANPNTPYPYIDLAHCKGESFILHNPEQNSGRMALELLEQFHITPHILLRTHSTEVAISLAATGVGLAFAPETYVNRLQMNLDICCFCVGTPTAQVQLMAMHRKGKFLPTYAQYFIELLKTL